MSLDVLIKGARLISGEAPGSWRYDPAPSPQPTTLGIRAGRIMLNCPDDAPAHQVVDATGLVVCPGFIDIHAHSDFAALYAPSAASKVLTGYTTELNGNCGYGAFPLAGAMRRLRAEQHQRYELDVNWHSVEQYFRQCERHPSALNQGLLIGHGTLRGSIVGLDDSPAKPAQRRAMMREVELAMRAGCFGFSTGLIYPPSAYADREEIVALTRVVAANDGVYASHLRSEADRVVEALDEFLSVCEETHCRAQYSHVKTSGPRNWEKLPAIRRRMDQALDRGVELFADRYPYTASQTDLAVMVLPGEALVGGNQAIVDRLKDAAARSRIAAMIRRQHEDEGPGWPWFDRLMICSVAEPSLRQAEGLTVNQWAERLGADDPLEAVFDLLIEDRAAAQGIHFSMSEDNMRQILRWPEVAIGSDSSAREGTGAACCERPHPRAFGTPARVLGQMVREEKLFDLPTAIYKMTGLPAHIMRLGDRGLIRHGYWADLVLFDPASIEDRATYAEPATPPVGIKWVFVNGEPVVSSNGSPEPHLTGQRPGKVLKFTG